MKENDLLVPIIEKRRISLSNVLKKNKINSYLISNQDYAGSWNLVSPIIFTNEKKIHSTSKISNLIYGNNNYDTPRPFDHIFLGENLDKLFLQEDFDEGKSVIFLHSYAGHGEYKNFIPNQFHSNIDSFYKNYKQNSITGKLNISKSVYEDYDSALSYIDHSLFKIIKQIENLTEPFIFLYFSDHGESVFTNRGHDSSNYIYEMTAIPLIVYFNKAAKNKYKALFEKYTKLSEEENPATLSQLPYTILNLLGLNSSANSKLKTHKMIGEKTYLDPIMVRRINNKISSINLNQVNFKQNELFSDNIINTAIVNLKKNKSSPNYCYHRSNTLIKFLRGNMISDCIELDIYFENNKFWVGHPPDIVKEIQLIDILNLKNSSSKSIIWLDLKNINSYERCNKLSKIIENTSHKKKLFLEFSLDLDKIDERTNNCILKLKQKRNIFTSYYYSNSTKENIKSISNSEIFTDISFDYSNLVKVKNTKELDKFMWNMWHVPLEVNDKYTNKKFRNLILFNDDPNNF